MSVTMNSIGMEMEEEENDNISSPPSPWRRYEFADSPVKTERIRPSTQRVKALLMGTSHTTRKVSDDDGMDGIIITEATSTTGHTIVTTGERSKGSQSGERSSKSTPNNMPFDSIPLSKEGGERRISSLSGIGSSGARVFAGITSSTNVSLVSDISADSVKRSSKQTQSTSPSRQKEASPNDSDTKRTETTLGTIMGTICEGIYDFCSTIIDDTTVGNNNNIKSKEERKKEAEETFLGKIIECPTFTCGGGECSDESEYTSLSEIIL